MQIIHVSREKIEEITGIIDNISSALDEHLPEYAYASLRNMKAILRKISLPNERKIPNSTKITLISCPCGERKHIFYRAKTEDSGLTGCGETPREAAEDLCRKIRHLFLGK